MAHDMLQTLCTVDVVEGSAPSLPHLTSSFRGTLKLHLIGATITNNTWKKKSVLTAH